MAVKQTAGREALGQFAPKFAQLNDDVLFGEVWSREGQLPLKLRSLVTVTALISKGIVDSSLKYHLESARKNGVTAQEMAETLTHIAFYAGWPNAWAAFRMAKEVYEGKETEGHGGFFGQGQPNTAFAQYFDGQSYLQPLTDPKETVFVPNVTLSPAAATTGTSTTPSGAAASSSSAWTARAGTRRRASPPRPCIPAMSSPSRRR